MRCRYFALIFHKVLQQNINPIATLAGLMLLRDQFEKRRMMMGPTFPSEPLRSAARADARTVVARRRQRLAPIAMLLLGFVGLLAVAGLHVFAVKPDAQVGIIFPADMSDDASLLAIVAAGGRPVRTGRSLLMDRKVWVAQGDISDFSGNLRRHGAWLVVNPYAFGGCLIRAR
jgi:hypothetical protein